MFGQPGERVDVTEHDGEFTRLCLRGVFAGFFDHFADQGCRHIVSEQGGQLLLGSRLQKKAIADVQHICHHHQDDARSQR